MQIDLTAGFSLELPDGDKASIWNDGDYEPVETALFQRELTPGSVVFDIGAHVGYFSILFSRLVGESGRVFAFEPDPINFSLLQRNLASNACHNVTVRQAAVSDRTGPAELFRCPFNSGMNRLYGSVICSSDHVAVNTVALDALAEELPTPDWIKLDVEGYELRALSGMRNLLRGSANPRLLVEFSPVISLEAGYSALELLEWMVELGFVAMDCHHGQWQPLAVERVREPILRIEKMWPNFYATLPGRSAEEMGMMGHQFLLDCGYERPMNENLLFRRMI